MPMENVGPSGPSANEVQLIAMEDPQGLTNLALPKTSATLTIRIIKSFEYRTERSLVLHDINLETTTVGDLKDIARKGITSSLTLPIGLSLELGLIE